MQEKTEYRRIILNLFDGSDASSGEGSGDGGSTNSGEVMPNVRTRGRELGLDDDLMEDYQKAFHSGNENDDSGDDEGAVNDNDNDHNEEAGKDEDLDAEFDELVKGKFKDAYHKRTDSFIKDRLGKANRDRAELESRVQKSDKVLGLLAAKYNTEDPDALYAAIRSDNDLWRQRALDSGSSVEDVIAGIDSKEAAKAQQQELESLRQYKAANELNNRLQALSRQTREVYPDFDLETEFNNPKFRQALDIIAAQNEQQNKQNGTSNEIFDITYAYELAHADELRANTIKRTAKAAANAAMQTIKANRSRPAENAAKRSTPGTAKSYSDMSDEEFAKELAKIERGEAKIRR